MKDVFLSILFALVFSHSSLADSKVIFKCALDPDQASQDFKIETLSVSFVQTTSGVSYVAGSLVITPAIPQLNLIDSETKTASDLNGTPATNVTNDLAVLGQNPKKKMAMLMTLASAAGAQASTRRMSIDVYSTVESTNQLESHLLCTIQTQ